MAIGIVYLVDITQEEFTKLYMTVHMLSHKKDYRQSYSAQIAVNVKNLCIFSLIQIFLSINFLI